MFKGEIGDPAGGDLSNCFFCLQERVGNFLADFYSVNGLVLESRKRREHLSEEDILRNKAIMESLSKGGNLIEQNFEVSQEGCHFISAGRIKFTASVHKALVIIIIIIIHDVIIGFMEHHKHPIIDWCLKPAHNKSGYCN